MNGLVKEVVEQKVLKLRLRPICCSDILQKDGANDATATPHESDRRLVKLPLVLLGSLHHFGQILC